MSSEDRPFVRRGTPLSTGPDIRCPNCGHQNPDGSTECERCQRPLSAIVGTPPAPPVRRGLSQNAKIAVGGVVAVVLIGAIVFSILAVGSWVFTQLDKLQSGGELNPITLDGQTPMPGATSTTSAMPTVRMPVGETYRSTDRCGNQVEVSVPSIPGEVGYLEVTAGEADCEITIRFVPVEEPTQ